MGFEMHLLRLRALQSSTLKKHSVFQRFKTLKLKPKPQHPNRVHIQVFSAPQM